MTVSNLSVKQLASRWDVTAKAVYGMIKRGDLAAFKAGGKLLRITLLEVERHECPPLTTGQPNTKSPNSEEDGPSHGEKQARTAFDDAHDMRLERLTG